MLIVLRLVAACGEAEHAHLSSLKMVRAEISTKEVFAAAPAEPGHTLYIYACAAARPKALQVSRPTALHSCLALALALALISFLVALLCSLWLKKC